MVTEISIGELEIVGYATVLQDTMLPSIVPPVFRRKADPKFAFLPPYSFLGGVLCNSTEVPASELDDLSAAREITLLPEVFPARAGYELWIDWTREPHYEPRPSVKRSLEQLADDAIREAGEALRLGDLQLADRLAGNATSADERRVEPYVIKAYIRRLNHNAVGERLMAELAEPFIGEAAFQFLVAQWERECEDDDAKRHGSSPVIEIERISVQRREPPMEGMANLRAA